MSRCQIEPRSIAGRTCIPALSNTNILAHAAGTTVVVRDLRASTPSARAQQRFLFVPRQQQLVESPTLASSQHSPDRSNGSLTLNFEEFAEPAKGRERSKSLVCLDISPDARFVIAGEAGQAPRILIWDLHDSCTTEPCQIICVHAHGIQFLRFAPDSRRFVSIGYMHDGGIHVFAALGNNSTFEKVATNRITNRLSAVAWNGDKIITIGTRHIKIWHCQAGKGRRRSLETLDRPTPQLEGRNAILGQYVEETFTDLTQVAEERFAIACGRQELAILDLEARQLAFYKRSSIKATRLHSCNGTLITDGECGTLELLEEGSLQTDKLLEFQSSSTVESIQGTERCTVVATRDGKIRVFIEGEEPFVLAGSTSVIHYAEQNGDQITFDNRAVATNHSAETLQQIQFDSSCPVTAVATLEDFAVLGSATGTLTLCSASGHRNAKIRAHQDEITNVSIVRLTEHSDVVLVASASPDRTIQLFQSSYYAEDTAFSLKLLQTCDEHSATVTQLLLLSDVLISAAPDRTVVIRRFEFVDGGIKWLSRKSISLKSAPTCWALRAPTELMVSNLDRTVLLIDLESGATKDLYKLDDVIDRMAISSNLLCCSHLNDKSVAIRSAETGVLLSGRGFAHTERLTTLAWSMLDASQCISTSSDGLTIFWHIQQSSALLDGATPVRKPLAKSEVAKIASPRQNLIQPLRRKAETPKFPRSPTRPLSPSKLGESRKSPSPTRRPDSCGSAKLPELPVRPHSRGIYTPNRSSEASAYSAGARPLTQAQLVEKALDILGALSAMHVREPLNETVLGQLRRAAGWFAEAQHK